MDTADVKYGRAAISGQLAQDGGGRVDMEERHENVIEREVKEQMRFVTLCQ